MTDEYLFRKQVEENVSTYCAPLIPCILELGKVVFIEGKRRVEQDRGLYPRMKSILQREIDGLEVGSSADNEWLRSLFASEKWIA